MHYTESGALDKKHIRSHFVHMLPYSKTYLVPSSTGDGWELSPSGMDGVIDFFVKETRDLEIRFLIGVLRPDADDAVRDIKKVVERLKDITGAGDAVRALDISGVCGFTVCPPKGKELSQDFIAAKLESIFDLGLPAALYQLPQITENEIAPETFERLVCDYSNLYLFKDTSGRDSVIRSGVKTGGVFLVRGGEGDYSIWYKGDSGGKYNGFLLGSVNSFAKEYHSMLAFLDGGNTKEAERVSEMLTNLVSGAMKEAEKIPFGNVFSNSNRAFDHFFAYGRDAGRLPLPVTHSLKRLPCDYIKYVHDLLERHDMLPAKGYLE
ncbi:MAG: dihydrodipicolinate synthase family protein [Treponema sp.]|nr:dihydrodipicolinate synthase family protein [Treponema sp.]